MDKIAAVYISEITVIDPDSGGEVQVSIFKDPSSGGMFGLDSSFIDQVAGEIKSPFTPEIILVLAEEYEEEVEGA